MDVLQTLLDSIEDPGEVLHEHRPYRKRKAYDVESLDLDEFSTTQDHHDHHDHHHGHHHGHHHEEEGETPERDAAKVPKLSSDSESPAKSSSPDLSSTIASSSSSPEARVPETRMPELPPDSCKFATGDVDPRLSRVSPEVDPGLCPLHDFSEDDERGAGMVIGQLRQPGSENHPLLPLIWQPNVPPCCQRAIVRMAKAEASCGNSTGFYILGMAAFRGYGNVSQDEQTSVIFLREAAELGNPYALNALGVFYEHGFCGLKASEDIALGYYTQAASLKNGNGLCNLGLFIERGAANLTKDEEKALKLFQLSADLSNSNGRYCLALYHYYGRGGLPVDPKKAAELLALSSAQCNSDAEDLYGTCLSHGTGVSTDMVKSIVYYHRSAVQGNVSGMRDLAFAYYLGQIRKPDLVRALYWYQKAIALGDEPSLKAFMAIKNRFGAVFDDIKSKADALIEAHNTFVANYVKEKALRAEPLS